MQGHLVDDRVPEHDVSLLCGSSALEHSLEHPTDQAGIAPAASGHTAALHETIAAELASNGTTPGTTPGTTTPNGRASPKTRGVQDWLRHLPISVVVALVLLLVVATSIGGGIIGARLAPTQGSTTSSQSASSPSSVTNVQQAVERAIQAVQPAVVQVKSRGAPGNALGSGVILTKDGYIATNDHVVRGYLTYTVLLSNGQSLSAQLIGEDVQNDVAVLKVAASTLTPITFADSTAVMVGEFVVVIGSPMGLAKTATFGMISAVNRTVIESSNGVPTRDYSGMIQLDMTLNPGNSGGALVDLQGRLIGMPDLRIESTSSGEHVDGMGFAVSSDQVKAVSTQLIQTSAALSAAQAPRRARQ